MTRRPAITFALILFFLLPFVLHTIGKISRKRKIQSQVQNIPINELISINRISLHIPKNRAVVFILFDPECEHCQSVARDFESQLESFSMVALFWISSATSAEIEKFSVEFHFSEKENIAFIRMEQEQVFKIFGSLSTPHLFIYGKDHQLIKEFKGETSVDIILKHLE